jgi:hypothetical protein
MYDYEDCKINRKDTGTTVQSPQYPTVAKCITCRISASVHFKTERQCSPCVYSMIIRSQLNPKVKLSHYTPQRRLEWEEYSSYSFLTSALGGGEWSASRHGRALPPGKGPPVPIVQKAGWAPEPVWTQRLEEKSAASAGDRTPIARSSSLTNKFLNDAGTNLCKANGKTRFVRISNNSNNNKNMPVNSYWRAFFEINSTSKLKAKWRITGWYSNFRLRNKQLKEWNKSCP